MFVPSSSLSFLGMMMFEFLAVKLSVNTRIGRGNANWGVGGKLSKRTDVGCLPCKFGFHFAFLNNKVSGGVAEFVNIFLTQSKKHSIVFFQNMYIGFQRPHIFLWFNSLI